MRHTALLALLALSVGCTAVNTAALPSDRSGQTIFVSAGDIPEPYESLGIVQAKRAGVLLFGHLDVVGTDIDAGLSRVLIPEVEKLGGDGAINVRFRQTQYLPATKIFFAFPFFFIPLPTQVVVTAEVVKLSGERPQHTPDALDTSPAPMVPVESIGNSPGPL